MSRTTKTPNPLGTGPFAGSLRIQKLAPPEAVWMRISQVPVGAPLASATIELDEVGPRQKRRARLRLLELTGPLQSIHRRLAAFGPNRRLAYPWPDFHAECAHALAELEVPIRVVIDDTGRATRPADLFSLYGAVPHGAVPRAKTQQQVRVAINWSPESYLDHIERHFLEIDQLETWLPLLAPLELPIAAHQVKAAVRFALRCADDSRGRRVLAGLQPEHWPIVEIYAAIAIELWKRVLEGHALHASSAPDESSPTGDLWNAQIRLLLRDEVQVPEGAEVVWAAPRRDVLSVASGPGGLARSLYWCTSHPRSNGWETLARRKALMQRFGGYTYSAWE